MARASRIRKHIVNFGVRDKKLAARAENRIIRLGPRATSQLIAACEDRDPNVRLRAAWSLGVIGDPRGFDAVVRLCNDPNDEVAYDSRIALGLSGNPRALDALLGFLNEPREERDSAPMGIVRMNVPVSKLEEFVSSADPKVRSLGVFLLLSNTEPGALDLAKRCLTDANPSVRAEAEDIVACMEMP